MVSVPACFWPTLASPPPYFATSSASTATLFLFSAVSGLIVGLVGCRRLSPAEGGLGWIVLLCTQSFSLDLTQVWKFSANDDAVYYVTTQILLLFTLSTLNTWLLCWDSDRRKRTLRRRLSTSGS